MARGDLFYEAWVEYPRVDFYRTDEQRRVHVTARWAREEAEAKLAEFVASQTARGYAPERFWVEEKRVDTDFEIPPLPRPRDRYTVEAEPFSKPGGVDAGPRPRAEGLRAGRPVRPQLLDASHVRTVPPGGTGLRPDRPAIHRHLGDGPGDGDGDRERGRILPGRLLRSGLA